MRRKVDTVLFWINAIGFAVLWIYSVTQLDTILR